MEQTNGGKLVDMSRTLSAGDIFATDDIEIVAVPVPEWGGVVYVKAMSGLDRERYFDSIKRIEGYGKKERTVIIHPLSTAKLVAATACNENGQLLFTHLDVEKLAKKSSKALQRLVDASAKLNGLDDEDDPKNGSAATTASAANSFTDSQVTSGVLVGGSEQN